MSKHDRSKFPSRHPLQCNPCALPAPSDSRNEKTRLRLRKPGLLVCRKEGLSAETASPVPPEGARKPVHRPRHRRALAAPPCSFSVGRDEIVTHSHAMHRLVAIAPLPPVPRHDLLTYRIPEPLRERVRPGVRVRVPLGRQTRTGVVAAFADTLPPGELRSIVDVLDADPFLPADLLALCRWTARYYLASLAEVIATVVPASAPPASRERIVRLVRRLDPEEEAALARRAPARARAYAALAAAPATELSAAAARAAGVDAGLRALVASGIAETVLRDRTPLPAEMPAAEPRPELTAAQRAALDRIAEALAKDGPASFVLHGVTGSGKTEVFLCAAERALAAGRSVLLLVPEIALTHQLVDRVRARFGDAVAVLHSGLGPRERWDEWRRVRHGSATVVVGARSAVFA